MQLAAPRGPTADLSLYLINGSPARAVYHLCIVLG